MAPLRTQRRFAVTACVAAAGILGLIASSCSSSSDAAFEIADTPTQTPLPARPTATPEPSPTPEPEPTATPAAPGGVAADVNLPPLTTNEPFTWPTNGMEQVTSDAIAIAVRTVIEYENVEQYILNDDRTQIDHTVAEWQALEPYLTDGFSDLVKANRESAVESGVFLSSWDDISEFYDFRVELPTDSEYGDLLLRMCIHGQGPVETGGSIETVRDTMEGLYYFDATGVLPKLRGYVPGPIVSETEFVPCDFAQ